MLGGSVAMADDLQTGICSDNWWNSSRTELHGLSTPCSMSPIDVGSFGWTDMVRSCEEPESILDTEKPQLSNSIGSGSFLIDSMAGFGLLATPVVDWNEPLLQSSGRAESNLHTILHEDSTSTESFLSSCEDDSINAFKQMNQSLNIDQNRFNSGDCTMTCHVLPSMVSPPFGDPPTFLQGLFHSNPQPPQQIFDNHPMNYANLNEILINVGSNSNRFSQTQFISSTFDEKPNIRNLMPKLSTEVHRLSSKSETETTSKRPRIETPSPLPTFRVRKEKLGDRITALQQLVSPFGKTDTASVLSEAIDYIKFLHDQVNVLSTHYVKNGASMQHQQNSEKWKDENDGEQDLGSRGLCLVPISSTFPVTTVASTDFWAPTMGASFK